MEKELTAIKVKQDSILFMTNKQYEKEYEIYLELFEKLAEMILCVNSLFPTVTELPANEKERLQHYEKLYKPCNDAYNELLTAQKKYGPFYQKNVREKLEEVLGLCFRQMRYFRHTKLSKKIENPDSIYIFTQNQFPSEMGRLENEIEIEVRKYLKKLRTVSMNVPG